MITIIKCDECEDGQVTREIFIKGIGFVDMQFDCEFCRGTGELEGDE